MDGVRVSGGVSYYRRYLSRSSDSSSRSRNLNCRLSLNPSYYSDFPNASDASLSAHCFGDGNRWSSGRNNCYLRSYRFYRSTCGMNSSHWTSNSFSDDFDPYENRLSHSRACQR